MNFGLSCFRSDLVKIHSIQEIVKCNDFTVNQGLVLTEQQAAELVETRTYALQSNGRIEFGGGVISKIITQFCDSAFLSKYNYSEVMHELVELFYYYKNETLDLVSDDDLIRYMRIYYDGVCQGSLELLAGRELARMAKNIRYGYPYDYTGENTDADAEEKYESD